MVRYGPSCYICGEVWDDEGKSEIVQIFISHDTFINSIQFLYADNGNLILSEVHGDTAAAKKINVVRFDYPFEFLTSVSGDYTKVIENRRFLATITFGTNKGTYGPYGSPGQGNFKFDYQFGPDRSFGGFHGSSHSVSYCLDLETIGIYIKPIASLNDINKNVSGSAHQVKKENVHHH